MVILTIIFSSLVQYVTCICFFGLDFSYKITGKPTNLSIIFSFIPASIIFSDQLLEGKKVQVIIFMQMHSIHFKNVAYASQVYFVKYPIPVLIHNYGCRVHSMSK